MDSKNAGKNWFKGSLLLSVNFPLYHSLKPSALKIRAYRITKLYAKLGNGVLKFFTSDNTFTKFFLNLITF